MHDKSAVDFDIAIIGASIAGSTAATLLGRAGLKVALIDKSSFPRRKPCGEGLSNIGIEVLKRIGLANWTKAVPHLPYDGYRLNARNTARTLQPFKASGVTIQRNVFDDYLLRTALMQDCVRPFFGQRVTALDSNGTLQLGSQIIKARYVLLANGANSRLALDIGAKAIRSGTPRMGITATFQGRFVKEPRLIHIFIEKEFELFCTPLPGQRLNLSILTPFNTELNLRSLILNQDLHHKVFAALRFKGELELSPMGRAPIANVRRSSFISDTLLLGDAVEEFDPIGGMGMSHALICAELATHAILKIERREMDQMTAFHWYQYKREQVARQLRTFTRLCYYLLRASHSMPILLNLAASPLGKAVTSAFTSMETKV